MKKYELLEEIERLGLECTYTNTEEISKIKLLDVKLGVMKILEIIKQDKMARIFYSVPKATILFNGEKKVFEGEATENIYDLFLEYVMQKGVEIK